MGTEAPETATPENAITEGPRSWPIEVRANGTVIFDGIAIGGLSVDALEGDAPERPRLTLNLGWLRLAGVGITLENDPTVDRNRTGIVLER